MQKQEIIAACHIHLTQKINELKTMMKELSDAADSESKSTAGDKHETGRAMIQLEQEKLGKQLKDAEEQLAGFQKIDFTKNTLSVIHGSLVETNKGFFLIADSIGKIEVAGKTVFVISEKSPLALVFLSKKSSDRINFNGTEYQIKNIK